MSCGASADPRGGLTTAEIEDELRTARLLFDAELTDGLLTPDVLTIPAVRAATRVRHIPPRPMRLIEQVRCKLGRLELESAVLEPLLEARQAALGQHSTAPPRFLIRVDEFPHYQAWDDSERFGLACFERFHEVISEAGVPYLLAVLPYVSREPLSPSVSGTRPLERSEVAALRRLTHERVLLALHGRDHRTRFVSSRRHSELCGLDPAQTEELLDDALGELARHELRPEVFVPPYNRFDARQFDQLARRFAVVCGGPESIGHMGFQRTPQWRGEAVYLPSYAPLYGRASEMLVAARKMIERGVGLWLPIVLHWGWEAQDGWRDLERLVECIAPYATPWNDFLAAVDRSRGGTRT